MTIQLIYEAGKYKTYHNTILQLKRCFTEVRTVMPYPQKKYVGHLKNTYLFHIYHHKIEHKKTLSLNRIFVLNFGCTIPKMCRRSQQTCVSVDVNYSNV